MDDATALAERLADAEGLMLVRSSNQTGYLGVSMSGSRYVARGIVSGTSASQHLGSFDTAAEAALAYARHLGPARIAQEAARKPRGVNTRSINTGFGVPHHFAAADETQRDGADASVVSVLAEDDEQDDGSGDAPTSVQLLQEPPHVAADAERLDCVVAAGIHTPAGSSGPPLKRKRVAHTDEYEFTIPPHARELTVPVPEGAVRATCTITFHFAPTASGR